MKAILMSIQPKWCELIANGEKTIEVRKTRPKIETPFKCYIYMTATKERCMFFDTDKDFRWEYITAYQNSNGDILDGSQKVIGEFVCDSVTCIQAYYGNSGEKHLTNLFGIDIKNTCLSLHEIFDYIIGKEKKDGTGWLYHISNLKIYDKPKTLDMFRKPCSFSCEEYGNGKGDCSTCGELNTLTRAPQSWCYVEELQ